MIINAYSYCLTPSYIKIRMYQKMSKSSYYYYYSHRTGYAKLSAKINKKNTFTPLLLIALNPANWYGVLALILA